jgi:hypothetical protein
MAGVDVPPRVQAGTILRTQVDSPLMRHPLVLYLTVKVESQGTSPL